MVNQLLTLEEMYIYLRGGLLKTDNIEVKKLKNY